MNLYKTQQGNDNTPPALKLDQKFTVRKEQSATIMTPLTILLLDRRYIINMTLWMWIIQKDKMPSQENTDKFMALHWSANQKIPKTDHFREKSQTKIINWQKFIKKLSWTEQYHLTIIITMEDEN